MDQVSLPMRIALLVVLAFAGLWLVALRPKPAADVPATPTAKTAPKNGILSAPDKARAAVAKANGASAKTEAATGQTSAQAAKPAQSTAPTTSQAAKPASAAATTGTAAKDDDVPSDVRAVLADLEDRKVVVLLFWQPEGADDREVRDAVARVNRHGGRVVVRVARTGRLGAFEPVTRGLPIVTSPSVVVIDRTKKARVISGLTVSREIDQAVGVALKAR